MTHLRPKPSPSTPTTIMNDSSPSSLYMTSTDIESDSEDISDVSSIELSVPEDGSE